MVVTPDDPLNPIMRYYFVLARSHTSSYIQYHPTRFCFPFSFFNTCSQRKPCGRRRALSALYRPVLNDAPHIAAHLTPAHGYAFLASLNHEGHNAMARLDASLRRWMGIGSLSKGGFAVSVKRVGASGGGFGGYVNDAKKKRGRKGKNHGAGDDDDVDEDEDGRGGKGLPLPEATRRLSIVLSIIHPRHPPGSTMTSTNERKNDSDDDDGDDNDGGGGGDDVAVGVRGGFGKRLGDYSSRRPVAAAASHPKTPNLVKYHALMRHVSVPALPSIPAHLLYHQPPRGGGRGDGGGRGASRTHSEPPWSSSAIAAEGSREPTPPTACFAAWDAAAGQLALAGEPEVRDVEVDGSMD